jgi:UDP-N-acetylglucosamine 2-epimerase (hydrolysing)
MEFSHLRQPLHSLAIMCMSAKPDLIVIHGDRIEALAAVIVGNLNNIKVAHIEGGEVFWHHR